MELRSVESRAANQPARGSGAKHARNRPRAAVTPRSNGPQSERGQTRIYNQISPCKDLSGLQPDLLSHEWLALGLLAGVLQHLRKSDRQL